LAEVVANISAGKFFKAGGSTIKNGGTYLIKDGKTFNFIGSQMKSSVVERSGAALKKGGSAIKSVGLGVKKTATAADTIHEIHKGAANAGVSNDALAHAGQHHHLQHLEVKAHNNPVPEKP
jgi:hypothetical protein